MEPAEITQLEEISINALPALHTLNYGGWVIRLAGGYTRRANSVHPLYPSSVPVLDAIRACEQIYQSAGQPIMFKMTHAVFPSDLDKFLEGHGYNSEAVTCVQVMDLDQLHETSGPIMAMRSATLSQTWSSAYQAMSAMKPSAARYFLAVQERILIPRCYTALAYQGQVVACGLGIYQAGCVGLFDIITHPGFRKQGFGEQIVRDLLAWGKEQGAQKAYLQVMLDNAPAIRLYERVGFREAYQYWYRIKG